MRNIKIKNNLLNQFREVFCGMGILIYMSGLKTSCKSILVNDGWVFEKTKL